jgi:hypothetical protein
MRNKEMSITNTKERYAPACIDERLPFGGGSVMVWAGISSEARIDLVFIQNGSLTAHRYITEVLEDHVMPFMITVGEHGILMHDNARPHAAVLSEDIRMRSELGDLIGQHSVQT